MHLTALLDAKHTDYLAGELLKQLKRTFIALLVLIVVIFAPL